MRVLRVRGFALLLLGQAISEIGQLDRGHRHLGLRVVPVRRRTRATSPCCSWCSRCRARCSDRCSACPSTGSGPRRTLLIANLLGFVDALAAHAGEQLHDDHRARAAARVDRGARHRVARRHPAAARARRPAGDGQRAARRCAGRRHRGGPTRRRGGQRPAGASKVRSSPTRRPSSWARWSRCGSGSSRCPGCRTSTPRRPGVSSATACSLARRIRGPALDPDRRELRVPALGGVRRARAAVRARRARRDRRDVRVAADRLRRRPRAHRAGAGRRGRTRAPGRGTSRSR